MAKTGMLIRMKNGDRYLAKHKTVNPIVYLPTFEVDPPPIIMTSITNDEEDMHNGKKSLKKIIQKPERPEIINNLVWFFFVTVNGTETYKRTEDVEGWHLVKYEVGAESYFVHPLKSESKGNDSLFRDIVPFHI